MAALLDLAEGRQYPTRVLPQEGTGLQLDHHIGGRNSREHARNLPQTIQTFVEDKAEEELRCDRKRDLQGPAYI